MRYFFAIQKCESEMTVHLFPIHESRIVSTERQLLMLVTSLGAQIKQEIVAGFCAKFPPLTLQLMTILSCKTTTFDISSRFAVNFYAKSSEKI